jgi:hypothetical protein
MTFDEYLNKPDPMAGFCLADSWSPDEQAAARQAWEHLASITARSCEAQSHGAYCLCPTCRPGTPESIARSAAEFAAEQTPEAEPVQQDTREPWLLYLSDRADGVRGRYAIARWNPAGYREVWNLRSHKWAAFSDEVLTLDEAHALLKTATLATPPAEKQAAPSGEDKLAHCEWTNCPHRTGFGVQEPCDKCPLKEKP